MNRGNTRRALALFFAALLMGCGSNLASYHPRSPAEQGIKDSLLGFEKAWQSGDAEGVLALIHENASIMTGEKPDVISVSKAQYVDILPADMKKNPSFIFGPPVIGLSGDNTNAVIKTVIYVRGKAFFYTINMAEVNQRWLIMKTHYTFEN